MKAIHMYASCQSPNDWKISNLCDQLNDLQLENICTISFEFSCEI